MLRRQSSCVPQIKPMVYPNMKSDIGSPPASTMTLFNLLDACLPPNYYIKQNCLKLMNDHFYPFVSFCPFTKIQPFPTPILVDANGTVALWAQTRYPSAEVVDISHDELHSTLMQLAGSGASWTDYQSVRYGFRDHSTLPVNLGLGECVY